MIKAEIITQVIAIFTALLVGVLFCCEGQSFRIAAWPFLTGLWAFSCLLKTI